MLHVWAVVHPRGFYVSLEIIKVSLGICDVWLILMLQKLYYLFLSCVQPCLKTEYCKYLDYGKTLPPSYFAMPECTIA